MSPVVITYGGVLVAVLIVFWGIFEIGKRFFVLRRSSGKKTTMWVTMRPSSGESDGELADEGAQSKHITRARHNGHYSESNKKL